MQSTDGGESWIPYAKERQEHFCKVYLKDPNTGYKTACEFLSKVSADIFQSLGSNKVEQLLSHPRQCTEYYCSESEGWALGWCLKSFQTH